MSDLIGGGLSVRHTGEGYHPPPTGQTERFYMDAYPNYGHTRAMIPSRPFAKLKIGRHIPVRAGHPWVFSEAIEVHPVHAEPGSLVEVQDSLGNVLGMGTWNPKTSIRIRMIDIRPTDTLDAAFFATRFAALHAWKLPHLPPQTTGYRLVHAETDGLGGLIVDRYDSTYVFQIHTLGMDRLRTEIVEGLKQFAATQGKAYAIVERSDVEARRLEGLSKREVEVHHGDVPTLVPFLEDGVTFLADVLKGQKTGFFLDQRPARLSVKRLAKDRRVINLFSYTGAFGVHALQGGAAFVQNVDASVTALETAEKTTALNGFDPNNESTCQFIEADIFPMLEAETLAGGPYDLIICDPPALTKDGSHTEQALKAYTFLNTSCLRHLPVGGILVTSSCSGRISPEDFRSMLRIAAGRSRKQVRLLEWIGHDVDHAELLSFPEGRYLKTVVLQVTGETS